MNKYRVYYKTYKKGLMVDVDAVNRAEAIRMVRDSVSIIKVQNMGVTEAKFDDIRPSFNIFTLWKRGWAIIWNKFKNLFVNEK
jgi:hypothetical protein